MIALADKIDQVGISKVVNDKGSGVQEAMGSSVK